MNFFKRNKISNESETVLFKLREKMRKKLKDEEMSEETNADTEDSKEKLNETKEIQKSEDLWRVGIICKKDCYYLTQEILKILEKNGYEWKIVSSSYKIKCRKKMPESERTQKDEKDKDVNRLNVLIQIFGDIDKHNKDEFLVDLHKLSGNVMEFLEFSSTFVSCIQQEGLIVPK